MLVKIDADQVPKDGKNFIIVHEFKGNAWATTFRYNSAGILQAYNEGFDDDPEMAWTDIDIDSRPEGATIYLSVTEIEGVNANVYH